MTGLDFLRRPNLLGRSLLAGVAVTVLSLTGCGGGSPTGGGSPAAGPGSGPGAATSSAPAGGQALRVGSDLTYPPYAFLDGGEPAGFDPEVVRALAAQIGAQPQFQDTRFEQLIAGLKGNRFDLIASALYITAERAKEVDYIPYFTTGNSIVAKAGGDQPAAADQLCGKRAAVIKGGDIVQRLRQDASEACRAAGQEPVDVREFTTDPEATQALLAGQVEVHVTDAAVAKNVVEKTGGRLAITSKDLLYPIPVGLAVRKGNTDLARRVREGLDKLRSSGEYARLLQKYNLQEPDPAQVDKILGS